MLPGGIVTDSDDDSPRWPHRLATHRRARMRHVSYACDGMRCPSCGTQNEPDSRFCGGCGARLSGVEPRLAPTQKIETGAQPIQPAPAVAPHVRMPSGPQAVAQRTPSQERSAPQPFPLAPSVERKPSAQQHAQRGSGPQRPASIPPQSANGAHAANSFQTTTPKPRPDLDGSLSMPLPRQRRTGLIAFVLLIDVGLAAAGAWMLREGLASGDTATAEPAPAAGGPTSGSAAAPAPPPSGSATGSTPSPASGAASALPPSGGSEVVTVGTVGGGTSALITTTQRPATKTVARGSADARAKARTRKKKPVTVKPGLERVPVDPYGDDPSPPPPSPSQPQ